jgi:hypothetical protein
MVRTPFQGDFVVHIVPRAEALGCFLLALQAIETPAPVKLLQQKPDPP